GSALGFDPGHFAYLVKSNHCAYLMPGAFSTDKPLSAELTAIMLRFRPPPDSGDPRVAQLYRLAVGQACEFAIETAELFCHLAREWATSRDPDEWLKAV